MPLLALTPPAFPADNDLSNLVRRAVVRGAQIADQADSVWQQVSGEVVPAWQKSQPLTNLPPTQLEPAFAEAVLALPLEVGAQCCGEQLETLVRRLPAARQEAVLLYGDGSIDGSGGVTPLNNEPFYGKSAAAGVYEPLYGKSRSAAAGTAVRGFSRELATAAERGEPVSNATLFAFEAYARWRVIQARLRRQSHPRTSSEPVSVRAST